MSKFLFYAPSNTMPALKYSINQGMKTYSWSQAAGVWTDKAIDPVYVRFSKNNDNDSQAPQKKFVAFFDVEEAHRSNFIEGIRNGIKAGALPFYYTQENGEVYRPNNFSSIEMVDVESKNITQTALNREITKARIAVETLADAEDITDFDNLCWALDVPTVGKSPNELYLSLIEIANNTPKRILIKNQDNRASVKDVVNRATKLKLNGEFMIYNDLHINKYFCYDNPSQPFMNIESIVDTMINDTPRYEAFQKKVHEVYEPFKQEISSHKSAPKKIKKSTEMKQEEKLIHEPLKQVVSEIKMSKSEYENKIKDILNRVKDGHAKESEDMVKKEIKEVNEYYMSTNGFATEENITAIYDEIVESVFTNWRQRAKWMTGTDKIAQ